MKGKTKDQYEHMSFSPDGKMLLTTFDSDQIRIWSVETGKPMLTERLTDISESNPIMGLAFHPGGNYLLLVSESWSIIILHLKVYEEKEKITIEDYLKNEK